MNTNLDNKNVNFGKHNLAKVNIVSSLQEVECFLNNLNYVLDRVKFVKLFKKIK